MDRNNENWEAPAPLPDMEAELKKIRQDIRRRNWKIVLTSLVLVAVLLVGIVEIGIPAAEKLYWDPNTSTYIDGIPDLQLTMETYTELFCPNYDIIAFDAVKTGFASYSISVGFSKWGDSDRVAFNSYQDATLTKGELTYPSGFWADDIITIFGISDSGRNRLESNVPSVKKQLRQYPEYIQCLAAVTFTEAMTMEELMEFDTYLEQFTTTPQRINGQRVSYRTATMTWAAIENSVTFPLCGLDPTISVSYPYEPLSTADGTYPYLFTGKDSRSGETLETHFKSMLQFSQDQVDNSTGILPDYVSEGFYAETLEYVEQNGVKAYGGYIIATPDRKSVV